jgi:hypothetical protein
MKHNRGITTLHRRGTTAADNEWKLIHTTGNLPCTATSATSHTSHYTQPSPTNTTTKRTNHPHPHPQTGPKPPPHPQTINHTPTHTSTTPLVPTTHRHTQNLTFPDSLNGDIWLDSRVHRVGQKGSGSAG